MTFYSCIILIVYFIFKCFLVKISGNSGQVDKSNSADLFFYLPYIAVYASWIMQVL